MAKNSQKWKNSQEGKNVQNSKSGPKLAENGQKWSKIQVGNIGQNINPIAQCENFKILREINFVNSRSTKTTFLPI